MDLKTLLDSHRINKTQFARKLEISKQHLHRILNGANCSNELTEKIKDLTQCLVLKDELKAMHVKVESLENNMKELILVLKKEFVLLFSLTSFHCTSDQYANRSFIRGFLMEEEIREAEE